MCQCRRWCVDNNLSDGFCAKRTGLFITALELNPEFAHIHTSWNLILHQGIVHHSSVVRILYILIQCHADTLSETAFYLNSCQIRVQRSTAVNYSHIIDQFQFTGFFINFHFCHSDHKRWRRNRRIMALRYLKCMVTCTHGMHTDFRCCHGFSCGNTAYTVSFKTGIVHVALQHLSSCLLHLFNQMKCCLFHGFTGNVCRTGCVRSGIVR